ncbi:hypothetical protein HS125_03600 [bacterium]|nr:hypothetical protein [bacterium]
MRKPLRFLSLFLLVGLQPAPATTMVPLTLAQLEAASERIVIASAVARECRWQDKKIITVYRLEVAESIKGAATSTLEVTLPGGSVKEPYPLAMTVPGVPHLALKQRVLLFLQARPAGGDTITGWTQGCYDIRRDETGRERVDVPSFVLGEKAKARLDSQGTMALADFLAEIRRTVVEREARPK